MSKSKYLFQIFLIIEILYTLVNSAPARPDLHPFKQNDGTLVSIIQFGDEHYNYAKTEDGYLIDGDGQGNYVYVGSDGKPTSIQARNPSDRTDFEKEFLLQILSNQEDILKKHFSLHSDKFPETNPLKFSPQKLLRPSAHVNPFVTGERFFPVLVVSTPDFGGFDSSKFDKMLNQNGYNENGHIGSMKDYFISSSNGKFNPTFDIYPIKLPKNFGQYNGEGTLITAALDLLVERDDFKKNAGRYESVSPFIFMHPLSNDKAQTFNRQYYSHQYMLTYSAGRRYSKNGHTFDSYAFVAQKFEYTEDRMNMLGTFCHEFSHVLGLFDLYSTDSSGYATIGPNPYDVMALGLRNGDGRFPPTYSAFERESMGWIKMEELSPGNNAFSLKAISEMQAYTISNPNKNDEYYIIEYRPAVGFDAKIEGANYSGKRGANGVFIWYIDYDANVFAGNDPNGDLNHPRADVKKVINRAQDSFTDLKFVNGGGKAKVPGVFNFVFDGNNRACFTVNQSTGLSQCPNQFFAAKTLRVDDIDVEILEEKENF